MPSIPPLVVDLADADDRAGGKAAGLARLIAASLPVPGGFVVTGEAFVAAAGVTYIQAALPAIADVGARVAALAEAAESAVIPPVLAAQVLAWARALGGPLAVRSSMAIEDRPHAAAPGLGLSVFGVAPDVVWTAIRAVWIGSLTPLVAAYACGAVLPPPGVIVQREIAGMRLVIYTRPPGRREADEMWVNAGVPQLLRLARNGSNAPPALVDAVQLARDAENAIGAGDGADVELIAGAGGWAVVQARPIVHPTLRLPRPPPPPILLAGLRASARQWRRDVAHNPDPLSPAQSGLCELVERAAIAPFHLAVTAGILYTAPREGISTTPPEIAGPVEFEARFAELAQEVVQVLSGASATDDLDLAIARYLAAYRLLTGEISPLIAAGRRQLIAALVAGGASERQAVGGAAALVPRPPSSVAAAVADAAAGRIDRPSLLARIGDVSLAWDVAVPTFGERPELIDDAIRRARARPAPLRDPPTPIGLAREVALARAAADAAERDDLLFAHAQAAVRRALLAYAARADIDADDVCWLPLDEVIADARATVPSITPIRAAAVAAAARAGAARAAAWNFPMTIPEHEIAPEASTVWMGDGFGGGAAGPAAIMGQLADASRVPAGAVVVTRTITPALALVVEGAAALVCEHGSLLDHGAAMARELGIPCVVGCLGIVDALIDGDWLEVDSATGRVTCTSRI